MKLNRPERDRMDIGLVPMINVVFLLLIFFLMTARLVPPPPMDILAPEANSEAARRDADTLYLSRTGTLAFNAVTGEAAVMDALAQWTQTCVACPLDLMADQGASARDLTALLSQLGAIGVENIALVTVQK
ncbi:MAG: ExbD/TolR family protein [Litorimonas sp.]